MSVSGNLYPKKIKENLIFRFRIGKGCEQSQYKLASLVELIKRDPVNFFDLCLWTYDPRRKEKHLPFILYDFQEDLVRKIDKAITQKTDVLIEKSRDMGVSWLILGSFLRRWLFFNESFLVGSRKEELVDKLTDIDSLFEKMRYMLKYMFPFLLPVKYNSSYMKISHPDGHIIAGESMNESFARAGRYNAVLLDEFAHIHTNLATNIWQASGDSTPCRIPVSTPKGKLNKFATLRESKKIEVQTIHWSKHPYKDDEWYEAEKKRRTETEIAQELDISYIASAGKPFYGGFRKETHTGDFELTPDKVLLLGFDYGYHSPCCVFSQIDAKGRWIIHDMLLGEDETIRKFAPKVKAHLNIYYKGYQIRCYGDPAGNQKSDKDEKTTVEILRDEGFSVISKPSNTAHTNYVARKDIIEGRLTTIIDGLPALLVHSRCIMITEAFEGGYHYPTPDRFGRESEEPFDDEYFSHPCNSLEYIAVNVFSPVKRKQMTTANSQLKGNSGYG